MDEEKIVQHAIHVVNMFDQANTGDAIENMGHYGIILKDAIRILRKHLNKDQQRTYLTEEQAE